MKFLTFCNAGILAPALPVLLAAAGIYLFIRLRGYPLRATRSFLRVFRKPHADGVSPFRAATVALAGTLGVGNIAGVASAIAAGGAGAVFWMWISALFAMIVKYAETALAVVSRKRINGTWHGGAFYYMHGKYFPALFAAVCVFASFSIGNIIQVRAVSEAWENMSGAGGAWIGPLCGILVLVVVGGGVRKISDLTVRLIPALCILYVGMSIYVLAVFSDRIGDAFLRIFTDAFSFRAVSGGGLGYALSAFLRSKPLRYGIARGIMSNEAGCGTAPMAHAAAQTDSPAEQGCWGIFEVFCDTILLCTLTALVILVSGVPMDSAGSGMGLATDAFVRGIGPAAGWLLCICAFLFAFATVICWAYYGCEALGFLTPSRRAKTAYLIAFAVSCIYGAVSVPLVAWELADFATGTMTVINTVCVCIRADTVCKYTIERFGKHKKARSALRSVPRKA